MKRKDSVYSQKFTKKTFNQDNNTYSYLLRHVRTSDRNILDLGCSSGFIGRQIKKQFPKSVVVGVDNNPHDLQKAKKVLDQVFQLDLDNFTTEGFSQKFDLIILADIIEHLKYPKKFLRQLHTILKPNGRIILSIPNFSHYSVINRLLSHHWHYDKSGLLDRTHLHFYNIKTTIKLIESTNFFIKKIDVNQSLPSPYVQIWEMAKNKLPLIYSVYKKIYNRENMVFQYLFTFSSQKPDSYHSYLKQKNKVLSVYNFPIMSPSQYYFQSFLFSIKTRLKRLIKH